MATYLLIASIVIVICVVFNKVSDKLGIPMLLAFILLGMFFGSDGVVKIYFDNYWFAEKACSAALIFIMFYGGFGTNWKQAKPIAAKAMVLSSFGTIITALLVGAFCYFILHFSLLEGMLMGAVISSTDAASVFGILKSKKLNLKYNTASLLEVESGSNDPFSYMLTIAVLTMMNGGMGVWDSMYMIFAQLFFGGLAGVAVAYLSLQFLRRFNSPSEEFDTIFVLGAALAAFAIPTLVGGNGYLSAYLCGLILGNERFDNKKQIVHFFDALTGLLQMFLFFFLGLLCFPSELPRVAFPALCIAIFLTFVARPIAVFLLLTPFKSNPRQQLLVSWSGLRGVASIVFAILAVINPANIDIDVFNMVFCIVLFSILIQGTLIPFVARKLGMTDEKGNVLKTFTSYSDEVPVQFIEFRMNEEHPWVGKKLNEILLPPDALLVLIIRDGARIIPRGNTKISPTDLLILSGKAANSSYGIKIFEKTIEEGDEHIGQTLSEISGEYFIITIRRGSKVIIPKGNTVLKEGDVLIVADSAKSDKPEKLEKPSNTEKSEKPETPKKTEKSKKVEKPQS